NNVFVLHSHRAKHGSSAKLEGVTTGRKNVHVSLESVHGGLEARLMPSENAGNVGAGVDWQSLRVDELESKERIDLTGGQGAHGVVIGVRDFRSAKQVLFLLRSDSNEAIRNRNFI